MNGIVLEFAVSKDWKYLAVSLYEEAIVIWDLNANLKKI